MLFRTANLRNAALCIAVLAAVTTDLQSQPSAGDRNLVISAPGPAAPNARRVALVIGNGSYKEAPLTNPVNDARAIALALRESGFTVITRENADQRSMLGALREFGDRLRGGGVGLFYYAGHGMQIKGRNYLIPVGSSIDREDEVAYAAVDAQAILDKMESAGNGTNIMILDACRNNPFTRSFRSSRAGLAQMDAPVGTLVAFATSPGAVASDGDGQNGLYTQHLLTAMRQSGAKVEDVFKQVRSNVRRDSQGRQVPWEATSLEGDFYFMGGRPAEVAVSDASAAVESALWEAVKGSSVPLELRAYLSRYPNGKYAGEANARLAQLASASASPPSPQRPTTSNSAPVPTAAARPPAAARIESMPPASPGGRDAVDRRTNEILAELAALGKPSSPTGNLPAAQRPTTSNPAPLPTVPIEGMPPVSPGGRDAANRRTDEILAELAALGKTDNAPGNLAPARVSQNAAATPTAGAKKPAPARNANGFTVGDRWRYQIVDKYKGEVVANWSYKVDRILDNGDLLVNGNTHRMTPNGNFTKYSTADLDGVDTLVPTELRPNYTQAVKFVENGRRGDGSTFQNALEGELTVKGMEKVKVPAGEFNAWRIERVLTVNGKNLSKPGGWYGRLENTYWYVPDLRIYVAMDYLYRTGSVPERSRRELTSFEISSVQVANR